MDSKKRKPLAENMRGKLSRFQLLGIVIFVILPISCCLCVGVNQLAVNAVTRKIYCEQLSSGMSPEAVEEHLRQFGSFTILSTYSFSDVREVERTVVWIQYNNSILNYFSGGETGLYFEDGKYLNMGVPIGFAIEPAARDVCRNR